jgi:hypothetical protein
LAVRFKAERRHAEDAPASGSSHWESVTGTIAG